MERLKKYMAAFDGSTDWASIEPLFDELFHPDCVIGTADGLKNKVQWAEMAKGLRAKGSVVSDFEITKTEGDAIYYTVKVTPGGGDPIQLTAKGVVKDDQLLRVEPLDPAAYSEMVRRST